jgi:hypothetical protein
MTRREIDALETFWETSCLARVNGECVLLVPLAFVGPRLAREKKLKLNSFTIVSKSFFGTNFVVFRKVNWNFLKNFIFSSVKN